jgi:hypothetical protein
MPPLLRVVFTSHWRLARLPASAQQAGPECPEAAAASAGRTRVAPRLWVVHPQHLSCWRSQTSCRLRGYSVTVLQQWASRSVSAGPLAPGLATANSILGYCSRPSIKVVISTLQGLLRGWRRQNCADRAYVIRLRCQWAAHLLQHAWPRQGADLLIVAACCQEDFWMLAEAALELQGIRGHYSVRWQHLATTFSPSSARPFL